MVDENGRITGPGEGRYILVYEYNGASLRLMVKEDNPALNAEMHRGLYAIRRIRQLGVDSMIVSEIGRPGFNLAKNLGIRVYVAPEGTPADEYVTMVARGLVEEAKGPTHEHGHIHHMHEEDG